MIVDDSGFFDLHSWALKNFTSSKHKLPVFKVSGIKNKGTYRRKKFDSWYLQQDAYPRISSFLQGKKGLTYFFDLEF